MVTPRALAWDGLFLLEGRERDRCIFSSPQLYQIGAWHVAGGARLSGCRWDTSNTFLCGCLSCDSFRAILQAAQKLFSFACQHLTSFKCLEVLARSDWNPKFLLYCGLHDSSPAPSLRLQQRVPDRIQEHISHGSIARKKLTK